MKTSETIDLLASALAAAQAEMPNATHNKVNPHFRNSYADLAAIREATLPSLTKNGLSIIQVPTITEDGSSLVLLSRLMHKSGQWIEAEYPIGGSTPQARGSELTYARRYSWSSLTGVAADEDDDAEVAEGSAKNPASQTAGPKKTPHAARKNKDWEALKAEMDATTTVTELQSWGLINSERIHALPDSWQIHFREAYDAKRTELREGVTETGEVIDDEVPDEGGGSET